MKKLDLGQTINTLANVGVIGGIVFLGIELHQNNDLLDYQKRLSGIQLNLDVLNIPIENEASRRALLKLLSGEELPQEESFLMSAFENQILEVTQWRFLDLPESHDEFRAAIQ